MLTGNGTHDPSPAEQGMCGTVFCACITGTAYHDSTLQAGLRLQLP